MTFSHEKIVKFLHEKGFDIHNISTGLVDELGEQPMILFDHGSYPGMEAHVFTAANSAFWTPRLDENGDVIVSYPRTSNKEERILAWERLLVSIRRLTGLLQVYREHIMAGSIPSTIWAHHDTDWYRELRDAPYHEKENICMFIDYVDPSIRTHIKALNEYGFKTLESCSGLPRDHLDRAPYRPYVMLDERAYPGCIPHFFTLADIADWIPSYAPHNFDVYIRIRKHCVIEESWSKLVQSAKSLDLILSPYRQIVRSASSDIDEVRTLNDSFSMRLVNR
ncbi:hypothetical protein EU527_15040 [Candidatus Thorarchaeota archaeon]|nr:MAG: hypothetical protein EU527_15040 [Candidatus Thorarchaeota archaeon]